MAALAPREGPSCACVMVIVAMTGAILLASPLITVFGVEELRQGSKHAVCALVSGLREQYTASIWKVWPVLAMTETLLFEIR